MPTVHHDRLRDLSRLYSYGRFKMAARFLMLTKGAVCGSWKENTGFQYCKSKEQLLRNTWLLKRSVSSLRKKIPVRDCVKSKTCAIAKWVHFPSRFGMPKAHHDRLRDLSRLYSYGRSLYSIQNGCRISHAWIFKVAVCGSWKENTGFQYCKSQEQLRLN